MKINHIYQGDALSVLKTFPENSIDMVMTSPPYWGLRDYGVEGQLGLESTFEEYIWKLCNIFDEVKRVLKKEGSCWVNLGDTYSATRWSDAPSTTGISREHSDIVLDKKTNLPDKCLCMVPERFAIEMVNRGWILRNQIIWHKPNCMPSSVKDRFTVDFEKIFFFAKNKKYYFEQQFGNYQSLDDLKRRSNMNFYSSKENSKYFGSELDQEKTNRKRNEFYSYKNGRNKRTTWKISTESFSEAHFAVYPEKLCRTPIKAGCPEYVCRKCGKPKEKVIETEYKGRTKYGKEISKNSKTEVNSLFQSNLYITPTKKDFKGYSDCGCNVGFSSGIVLDPFFGAGTTGLVARKLNRNFIGIELNEEYISIAQKRLDGWIKQTNLQDFELIEVTSDVFAV